MAVIDLTRVLSPGMPVYPGDPEVSFEECANIRRDGFRVTQVQLGTHAGTHLDAPAHFLENGASVDILALDHLVGPARLTTVGARDCALSPGERLIIRSGWSSHWGQAEYFSEFPGLERAFVQRLINAPVRLIGLETPSLHPDHVEDAALHRLLLERGIVVIENLVNVELLPDTFYLAALPLALAGLDGAPARVVAITDQPAFVERSHGDKGLSGDLL